MKKLAILVRGICNAKGMLLGELATKMGINPVSLSRTLSTDKPRHSTFEKLAKALEMNPDVLEEMYNGIDSNDSSMPRLIMPRVQEIRGADTAVIAARYYYKGTLLYAASIQDMKDITNVLSMLESMTDKEQYDSTLSLLVKQFGELRY